MTDLRIVMMPNSVLTRPAQDVVCVDQSVLYLIVRMLGAVREWNGVGLAAPQVNISQRLCVFDMPYSPAQALIDPVIVARSQEMVTEQEGCLSLPGIIAMVSRHQWIELETLDLLGEKTHLCVEGFAARVMQHEIDHLDGILMTDRAETVYKEMPLAERVLGPAVGTDRAWRITPPTELS